MILIVDHLQGDKLERPEVDIMSIGLSSVHLHFIHAMTEWQDARTPRHGRQKNRKRDRSGRGPGVRSRGTGNMRTTGARTSQTQTPLSAHPDQRFRHVRPRHDARCTETMWVQSLLVCVLGARSCAKVRSRRLPGVDALVELAARGESAERALVLGEEYLIVGGSGVELVEIRE